MHSVGMSPPRSSSRSLSGYGIALLSVAACLGVRLAFASTFGAHALFVLWIPAVAISAWYGGLGPGLVATALGGLSAAYFIIEPTRSFRIQAGEDQAGLIAYAVTGILLSALTDAHHRAQARSARAFAAELAAIEQLALTLRSIGDAVIATDREGKVGFLNRAAEELTGWALADARGHALDEVLRIVDDETRQPVESPLGRVLATGAAASLARTPLLLARDGRERSIADSAAPIRGPAGEVRGVVFVFRDITVERNAQRAAAEERRRTLEVLASIKDAFVSLDAEWRYTFANEQAEKLLDKKRDELLGRVIWDLFPYLEGSEVERAIRRAAATRTPETLEARDPERGGWFEIRLFPTPDGLAIYFRDVTERRKRADEQEQLLAERTELLERERAARAEAEEANRVKDEFLATVSHELRTPLNAILGWARLLRTGALKDEEKRGRAVETIERNAAIQAQLIEDLLDVSRIISGKLRLEFVPVDLERCVEAAVEACRPGAEAKGLVLETSFDAEPPRIQGDPDRIQQIVWNLVANAVKFTPEKGRVAVRVARAGPRVRIEVSDTGQGISPEFMPHVFDRFRQADSGTTRRHTGLGLGLAIVRHLVELHGGTVSASSEGVGKGARFTVELPVPAISPPTPDSGTYLLPGERARTARLDRLRVLVVDDEKDARDLLAAVLAPHGATVVAASSVDEALREIDAARPDVLVSDIAMPQKDGYRLLEAVRSREGPEERPLPAVALTAYARAEDRRRALAAGFRAHLAKPVDPEALVATVAKVTGRSTRH